MDDPAGYVRFYVARLDGPEREGAFHRLLEGGVDALPHLVLAFKEAEEPSVRAQIVEVIGQTRVPAATEILATALKDRAPVVWKAALDGLVTVGGPMAATVLDSALASSTSGEYDIPVEWLTEGLAQVRHRSW